MNRSLLWTILAVTAFSVTAMGQTPPQPAARTVGQVSTFLDADTLFTTVFAGSGVSSDGIFRPVSAQFGGSAGIETLSQHVGGLRGLSFVEVGAIGPLADRGSPAALVSYDFGANILLSPATHMVPFAVGGYSYLFGEGSAINFGLGTDLHYRRYRAIRVEVRDYYTFTETPQHNVALRIGWKFAVNDP